MIDNKTLMKISDEIQPLVERDGSILFAGGFSGGGACLSYTYHGIRLLRKHNLTAILQAGDAHWKISDNETVEIDNWFGYSWSEAGRETGQRLTVSNTEVDMAMPEVHCWIGILGEDYIVDFSTRDLVRTLDCFDISWEREAAPPQVICTKENQASSHYYKACRDACEEMHQRMMVYHMLCRSITQEKGTIGLGTIQRQSIAIQV